MTRAPQLRLLVRERAAFACEFCGVTELDSGGELTIDHYHPVVEGGTHHPENLLYCCSRCNTYKGEYWPQTIDDPSLWNPRIDNRDEHFILLEDGFLYPQSLIGEFAINLLRLNRPQLVGYRLRSNLQSTILRLLTQYQDVAQLSELLQQQERTSIDEQQRLLDQARELMTLLLRQRHR